MNGKTILIFRYFIHLIKCLKRNIWKLKTVFSSSFISSTIYQHPHFVIFHSECLKSCSICLHLVNIVSFHFVAHALCNLIIQNV